MDIILFEEDFSPFIHILCICFFSIYSYITYLLSMKQKLIKAYTKLEEEEEKEKADIATPRKYYIEKDMKGL